MLRFGSMGEKMIRIKKVKTNDLLSFAAVFIAFLCATNGELANTNSNAVYYFPFLVCLAALLLELLLKPKIGLTSYLLWRIGVAVFFLMTMLYAISVSVAFVVIKKFLLQSVVVVLISLKCMEKSENIKLIIKIAVFAIFANLLYLLSTADMTMIAEGLRLGATTINKSWNANSIGLSASFGAIMAYYAFFIDTQRTGLWKKVFSWLVLLFFLVFTVLSGSRTAIIIVLVAAMLYILRSSQSHKIRNVLIAILFVCAAFYAVYNVPFLYEHVGYRFESLLEALFAEGGDRSSLIRREMIEVGMQAFVSKPVLGHGLNGFSQVYGSVSGIDVYAHNNYIELLVNTGLVGFLLYYGYIAGMLFTKCAVNKETILFKATLVALLIADVGLVSYVDPLCQYLLCFIMHGILQNRQTSQIEE